MLVVALASGGVMGVSKVRADIRPPLETPEVYAELGSIGTRAKQMNGFTVGQIELRFRKQKEQLNQGHPKIVVTSPMATDVIITQRYVCQMHSQRHINVRALESGHIEEISVKAGQAVKKRDSMFKIQRTRHQAMPDTEKAEAKLAKAKTKADLAKAELAG
jgi:membrane fusion protein (multidrug efflux system)